MIISDSIYGRNVVDRKCNRNRLRLSPVDDVGEYSVSAVLPRPLHAVLPEHVHQVSHQGGLKFKK